MEASQRGIVDAFRPLLAPQAQQQVPGTRHLRVIAWGSNTRIATGRSPLPSPATDGQVVALLWVVDAVGITPVHVRPPVPSRSDIAHPPTTVTLEMDSAQTGHIRTEVAADRRSEEHTSELQSRENLVCRLLLEKK